MTAINHDKSPGKVLLDNFMSPKSLSGTALANAIGVPKNRMTEIIRGRRGITADTAILLSAYFGTTAEYWMNLQTAYDLRVARNRRKQELS